MKRLLTLPAGVVALALLGLAPANGDAGTYITQKRLVRCGIIASSALNVGTYGSENPDPHLFYVVDSRTDLRPAGMEFVNPLAPPSITSDIYQRWRARQRGATDPAFVAGTEQSRAFQVGSPVTKNMGAYWEVNIDSLSAEDLAQFDLLFLHCHKPNVAFNAEQKAKLRRFMDAGGTLWIDQCGGFTFSRGAPFLFDVQYHTGGGGGGGAVVAAANHPLLSSPYSISAEEVRTLGDKNVGSWYLYNPYDPADPSYYDSVAGKDSLNPPGHEAISPIVWNTRGLPSAGALPNPGWRPYIMAGQVGAGRVVFCADDTGCAINDYVGGSAVGWGANSAAVSGEILSAAKPADLKFVYNMASWATAQRTDRTDSRRTGASAEQIGAQLEEKWYAPSVGPGQVGGAAFYKNAVYVVGGDLVLRCYNLSPGQDMDNDGNADDGITDFIAGASFDEVWRADLRGATSNPITGASTPTIVDFYDPAYTGVRNGLVNLGHRELVVVVLSDGTVAAFRALPWTAGANGQLVLAGCTAGENLDWSIPASATNAIDFGMGPDLPVPSAVWSEGVIFVALNTSPGGRLAAIDPRNGLSAFHPGAPIGAGESLIPNSPATGVITTSPTVGYVRDTMTGALDRVIYANVAGGNGMPASLRAYPFGTVGEGLVAVQASAGLFRSRSRFPWYIYDPSGTNGASSLRQRVFVTYNDPATGRFGSREIEYTTNSAPSANQYTTKFESGEQRIVIGASLTIDVENASGATSTVTASVSEEALTFEAEYTVNWSPESGATVIPNARSAVVIPDPGSSANRFVGAPALTPDGMLALFADTHDNSYPGKSVLFMGSEQMLGQSRVRWSYAMYDEFQMQVNNSPVTVAGRLRDFRGSGLPVNLTGVQFIGSPSVWNDTVYAVATCTSPAGPTSVLCAFKADQECVLRLNQAIPAGARVRIRQPNIFTQQANAWIEMAPSQFTVDNASGTVRITAMAPPGAITANFASASLPFVVQVGTGTEELVVPSSSDSDGVKRGGPDGVDNLLWYNVFSGTATSSPQVQGDTIWVGMSDGRVVSFDTDPTSRNPEFQGHGAQVTTGAVWTRQVGTSPILGSPVAASNVLAINSGSGVYTFEDNYTVIADSHRLIEVNSAGEAVWTCEGTRTYAVVGGNLTDWTDPLNPILGSGVPAVQRVAFNRPRVVRRINRNEMMVVDTGNNRVVQMDRGGTVSWEVSRLQDDYKHLLRSGDPLTLNEPSDCSYWTEYSASLGIGGYTGPGVVIHYLIADSGNFRVVEVIDAYDTNGRALLSKQLNYVSSTLARGNRRYQYRAVQRLTLRNSDLPASPPHWRRNPYDPSATPLPIRYLTLAAIGNVRAVDPYTPTQSTASYGETAESGGGSLMLLQEAGDPLAVVSNLRIPTGTGGWIVQPIAAPQTLSTFAEIVGGALTMKVLLTDANGCYQARVNFVDHAGPQAYTEAVLDVEWMLTGDDYYAMTGKRLQASSLVRLAASAENSAFPLLRQYLVCNRFSGQDDPLVFNGGVSFFNTTGDGTAGNISGAGEVHGEVFVVKPSTFSFTGALHGYIPDYQLIGGAFLWPNDGGTYVVNGGGFTFPQSSIIRRVPVESVPRPPYAVLHSAGDTPWVGGNVGLLLRQLGYRDRGTASSVLEEPAYADRPF